MKLEGPTQYRLSRDESRPTGLFTIVDNEGKAKFAYPATSTLPKLYIVTVDGEEAPVYVGITRQSMRSRLRYGWTADGRHGYHGYRWRDHPIGLRLDVWCDVDPTSNPPDLDIETLEAEIVFLIREKGQWPRYQTEIHFHPSTPEHRDAARTIVSRYFP